MPSQAPTQTPAPNLEPVPTGAATLPSVATGARADDSLRRLEAASRRGRLPGFAPRPAGGGLFTAAAHGHPFDGILTAHHEPGVRLAFRVTLLRRMPLVFAVILALTIWPGAYCMDELVSQLGLWRPEHPWLTYEWYLPLTIVPIPWIWRATIRSSRRSALEHARETIARIAAELGATVR